MFLRELSAGVDRLYGAGPAAVKLLAKLGITSVGGLLCHYPRDWEDRSRRVPLREWNRGRAVCTTAKVLAHEWFGAGRMKTLKIYVEDESARASLICFNRDFLARQLPVGADCRIWGRFTYKYGEIQAAAFEAEPVTEGVFPEGGLTGLGGIVPVYPLTAGLTQKTLRRLVRLALDQYAGNLEDELPSPIRERDKLLSKPDALRGIHFPSSIEELALARKTLIYEELFYLEVMIGKRTIERRIALGNRKTQDEKAGDFSALQKRLIERLPFALTPGQLEAVREINRDMAAPAPAANVPMARLLQGDVGSGKTLVSFLACLRAIDEGPGGERGQACLMAPTELLARQHAENAARLLEPLGVRIAFLTGNIKASGRAQLLKALAAGDIDMVAGTHALFSRDVIYRNLRLVVVDEQHRFGVIQRQAIMTKGEKPGLLMMSATPIPRTLALTVFGDLDVSVIRDMPPGRKAVKTHLARQSSEGRVYDFVRKELSAGHQAYFVYPLIENDEPGGEPRPSVSAAGSGNLKDVSSMAARLAKEIFPSFPVALIHSRMEDEDKRNIMDAFRTGDIRVLAATSVVEVGVDVPNATCMVIEHAERFGLSSLHQLRGRVGRGPDQAYCFLVYSESGPGEGSLTEDGKQRLMVMLENTDGFIIAEEDLKLRGPGQIAGIEQSGYLSLGIADPLRDGEALVRARADAFAMLEEDPGFSLPCYRCVAGVLERAPPFRDQPLA
jgi:ATP-dependent DNA helicase RecG